MSTVKPIITKQNYIIMATIYSAPEEIKVPVIDFKDIKGWRESEERFTKELHEYCKKHGSSEYAGEVVRIPHADSYAEYMVLSLKPARLVHMPLGDAWDSQYANLMTAKSIKEHVDNAKKIAEIFKK